MPLVLGIDTSNYTTSVAIFNSDDGSITQSKKLLCVKQGDRGLRQSEALFQHTRNLPEILEGVGKINGDICAVSVSATPRTAEGSYMPCFLAGVSAAAAAATALKAPLFKFSHQQGHIAAALYSANKLCYAKRDFLAFHISGGTTELLLVKNEPMLNCEIAAQTLDLNAGQLVDRVGVRMGLAFPAGNALEQLAQDGALPEKPVVKLKDGDCCLSGIENKCNTLLEKGCKKADVARYVFETVAEVVSKMTAVALEKYGDMPVVFAGGVMCNGIIKTKLKARFNCSFAEPVFSCDNAAGTAVLGAVSKGLITL